MKTQIYTMSVSLDGFIETPDREIDWVIVDEELPTFWNAQAREQSVLLYGRRMYETMIAWPNVSKDSSSPPYMIEFSHIREGKPKVVYPKVFKEVAWNSMLVSRDNLAEEIRKLKALPGKDMGISGATLAASLVELGLVNRYQFFVDPVMLRAGTRFLPKLDNKINLQVRGNADFSLWCSLCAISRNT